MVAAEALRQAGCTIADSSEIDQHSSAKPISVPVIPIGRSERSDAGDVDCGGSDRNRQGTSDPQRKRRLGWILEAQEKERKSEDLSQDGGAGEGAAFEPLPSAFATS